MPAHFRIDGLHCPHQKVVRPPPQLARTVGVFHRLAADAHTVGGKLQAGRQGFKDLFVLPASHFPLLVGGTLRLEGAWLAG